MKTIKIKFVGFWENFDPFNNFFSKILEKYYTIELSDDPDYVFSSVLGVPYEYCNYENAVRILFSGENYAADFNLFDYIIGFDRCVYPDRYLRYPLYLLYSESIKAAENKICLRDGWCDKTRFCNFIYGHDTDTMQRKKIFDKLNEYKRVDAAGSYLNNMGGSVVSQEMKLEFLKTYKFTIAVESCCLEGFITEKILHAFATQSIPIYLGDPSVKKDFNGKAFINCSDYADFDEVLSKVIELDQDNDKYLQMLREPVFSKHYIENKRKELESFLLNIFEQRKEDAYRRPRGPRGGVVVCHEKRLKLYNNLYKNSVIKFIKK